MTHKEMLDPLKTIMDREVQRAREASASGDASAWTEREMAEHRVTAAIMAQPLIHGEAILRFVIAQLFEKCIEIDHAWWERLRTRLGGDAVSRGDMPPHV
jgi:hypothetical protein